MNTSDRTLVTSYATALFAAARNKGILEKVSPQVDQLRQLVEADQRLHTFMHAPNIARHEKEAVFTRAFGGRFDDMLVNYMRLLVRRGHLDLLVDTLDVFHNLYLADKGVAEGDVTTAVELSNAQKAELQAALNKSTGKSLQLKFKVDPKVLGGVSFRSGDLLMENTLTSGLARLGQLLRRARVY